MAAVDIHLINTNRDGELQLPQLYYKKKLLDGVLTVYFERTAEGVRKHSHRFLDQEEPLEIAQDLPKLDSKVVVDAKALSFATMRYVCENGQLALDKTGMPRTFVNSTGYFDRGGGKYVLRLQGRPYFVPAAKIMEVARERRRAGNIASRRVDALKEYSGHAKKGDWGITRFFDFGISFPDYSYLTWLGVAGDPSQAVREPVGPYDSLAGMWKGWVPDQLLTPEVGPRWLKDRLANARRMLEGIKSLEALNLLPEKGDASPILKLEDDGMKVFRRVEVPSGLIVAGE